MNIRKAWAVAISPVRWTAAYLIAVVLSVIVDPFASFPEMPPLLKLSSAIGYGFLALGFKLLLIAMHDRMFTYSRKELPFFSMMLLILGFGFVAMVFLFPLLKQI